MSRAFVKSDAWIKARRRAAAYPKLVAALRGDFGEDAPIYDVWAQERFERGLANDLKTYNAEMTYALLRELGEES